MGITFEAPLALLLLVPALVVTIVLYLGARRRLGAGRRRAALVVRTVLLSALVLALAGFRLVLPVDRLATVFVVDLSDSVGNEGREEALAFLRETPRGHARTATSRASSRSARRRSSSGCRPSSPRSTGSRRRPVTLRDRHRRARCASPTALFPDDAQKRIVLLSDGNDTTGRGQAEAALAADPRRPDRDPARSASARPTRSSSSA